jgi:basic membrane protein A
MFKKHLFITLLILVVAALFAGCAAPAAPAPAAPTQAPAAAEPTKAPEAPAPAPAAGAFKMGLLLPGSANDQGWNTMAYNALKQVEKDLGAEVSYVELKQDPASYEKAFRDFAAQGYQLVMGHGNEFEDAAKAAAKDYPNVQFFISSSRLSEPTVTGLNTASEQPLYLMGMIAAKMCKAAGFVGGMEIPPVSEALTGFINGAKSVDPNFKVYSTYIGNFEDAAAAKEAALGMIAQGADCIVPDADAAGQGVYQAVVEKKDQGIKTFGVFVPATDAAPGQVLANYVSNYGQGVTNLAKMVKEGTYKGGKNVAFGFDMPDVIMLNYDETATTKVPDDVRAAVEAAKKQLAEGKIDALAAESAAPAPAAGAFKMGLLLPGSANDQGWNTMAYNALKQVEKDLGAEVSYVELKQDPASYEKAFRDFAAQGYQLIMGHGNEFEDAAKAAAKDYPNVQFFISSSRLSEPTVTGLNTASDQPLYLMGVIAAKMCKAAGFVGGMEIPPISEALTGFINGAKSVDPNFKVYSTYIGNFDDAAAAKEAALGMIAQGADCIVPDADAAGQGVYQAVVEKKDAGVKTFGVFVPATDAAPGQVLANYVSNYGQGVTNLAKQVKEGTYKGGKNVAFGFDMPDVIMLNYDETATTKVPDDVRAAVEAAKKQIAEGKIDTLAPVK